MMECCDWEKRIAGLRIKAAISGGRLHLFVRQNLYLISVHSEQQNKKEVSYTAISLVNHVLLRISVDTLANFSRSWPLTLASWTLCMLFSIPSLTQYGTRQPSTKPVVTSSFPFPSPSPFLHSNLSLFASLSAYYVPWSTAPPVSPSLFWGHLLLYNELQSENILYYLFTVSLWGGMGGYQMDYEFWWKYLFLIWILIWIWYEACTKLTVPNRLYIDWIIYPK